MTKCDKLDEDDPLVTLVTPADCDGNVLGVSTDSLFRDRLRYSNNETCQRTTNTSVITHRYKTEFLLVNLEISWQSPGHDN